MLLGGLRQNPLFCFAIGDILRGAEVVEHSFAFETESGFERGRAIVESCMYHLHIPM